jgi:hypothetical protein
MTAIVLEYIALLVLLASNPVSLSYMGLAMVHLIAMHCYLEHPDGARARRLRRADLRALSLPRMSAWACPFVAPQREAARTGAAIVSVHAFPEVARMQSFRSFSLSSGLPQPPLPPPPQPPLQLPPPPPPLPPLPPPPSPLPLKPSPVTTGAEIDNG